MNRKNMERKKLAASAKNPQAGEARYSDDASAGQGETESTQGIVILVRKTPRGRYHCQSEKQIVKNDFYVSLVLLQPKRCIVSIDNLLCIWWLYLGKIGLERILLILRKKSCA